MDAYCIENLLVDESSVAQILLEEASLSREDALAKLGFNLWASLVSEPLVQLFAAFAAAHVFAPTHQTVSRGVGNLLCSTSAGCLPQLDLEKVVAVRDAVLNVAYAAAGKDDVVAVVEKVVERARGLKFPLDVVSGKDFLLPLLDFQLREHRCRVTRRSLRLRLALHCNRERFAGIAAALESAAKGML